MIKLIIKNTFFIFFLFSCTTNKDIYTDRKWYLTEIEGDTKILVLGGKPPYIEFDDNTSKIGGNLTCNNFFTNYQVEGNQLKIGKLSVSKIICPDDSKQEYRLIRSLERIDSYILNNNKLYLIEGEETILIFSNKSNN